MFETTSLYIRNPRDFTAMRCQQRRKFTSYDGQPTLMEDPRSEV